MRKPPKVIAARIRSETLAELERFRAPRRDAMFDDRALLRATNAESLDALWDRVLSRAPFARAVEPAEHEGVTPGDTERVLAAASAAASRSVQLLGSPLVTLSTPIDWHQDFKTGRRWEPRFWRSIDYADRDHPSDVKVPWELSRVQWLIPCGQAYLLTRDESYARVVRNVLEEWIAANPYARSVNWAVTMEAAIRILTWTWLLGALGGSTEWRDPIFRSRFLRALYLHGDFTKRNLERSDVNGNHYTADASGLMFAGLLFDNTRWLDEGWGILCDELPRQVHADGVDFEASTAYHRLVSEFFLLAALYREQLGLAVGDNYRARVIEMGRFTAAYLRPDGSAPVWGDTDDARALPLDGAHPGDHRGLVGAIAAAWDVDDLRARFSGPRAQVSWLVGTESARSLPTAATPPRSAAFRTGGVYVLASARDHVFIDCGPVGLAGRGGHGHNDCLSFDAVLDGTPIVVDPGSYVYSASWEWRNRFRATASHNTPVVDSAEQATLDPDLLWWLGAEATPEARVFDVAAGRFVGAHGGYLRLPRPVRVVRSFELDSAQHRLVIVDEFEGEGDHSVSVGLQLPGLAEIGSHDAGTLVVNVHARPVEIRWESTKDWCLTTEAGWVSPSYGVKVAAPRLRWTRSGSLAPLRVELQPSGDAGDG